MKNIFKKKKKSLKSCFIQCTNDIQELINLSKYVDIIMKYFQLSSEVKLSGSV